MVGATLAVARRGQRSDAGERAFKTHFFEPKETVLGLQRKAQRGDSGFPPLESPLNRPRRGLRPPLWIHPGGQGNQSAAQSRRAGAGKNAVTPADARAREAHARRRGETHARTDGGEPKRRFVTGSHRGGTGILPRVPFLFLSTFSLGMQRIAALRRRGRKQQRRNLRSRPFFALRRSSPRRKKARGKAFKMDIVSFASDILPRRATARVAPTAKRGAAAGRRHRAVPAERATPSVWPLCGQPAPSGREPRAAAPGREAKSSGGGKPKAAAPERGPLLS